MGEGRAHVTRHQDLLWLQRLIRASAIEKIGQQYDIAAVREPLTHSEQRRPNAEAIHIKDHRRPRAGAPGCKDVGRARAVAGADRNLLVTHSATVSSPATKRQVIFLGAFGLSIWLDFACLR